MTGVVTLAGRTKLFAVNRKNIGTALLGLAAFALLGSGVGKLIAPDEKMLEMGHKLVLLALLEFQIVIFMGIPRTRLLGIILAGGYFGGIVAWQFLAEDQIFPVVGFALCAILYAGAALLYPGLTDGRTGVAGSEA